MILMIFDGSEEHDIWPVYKWWCPANQPCHCLLTHITLTLTLCHCWQHIYMPSHYPHLLLILVPMPFTLHTVPWLHCSAHLFWLDPVCPTVSHPSPSDCWPSTLLPLWEEEDKYGGEVWRWEVSCGWMLDSEEELQPSPHYPGVVTTVPAGWFPLPHGVYHGQSGTADYRRPPHYPTGRLPYALVTDSIYTTRLPRAVPTHTVLFLPIHCRWFTGSRCDIVTLRCVYLTLCCYGWYVADWTDLHPIPHVVRTWLIPIQTFPTWHYLGHPLHCGHWPHYSPHWALCTCPFCPSPTTPHLWVRPPWPHSHWFPIALITCATLTWPQCPHTLPHYPIAWPQVCHTDPWWTLI